MSNPHSSTPPHVPGTIVSPELIDFKTGTAWGPESPESTIKRFSYFLEEGNYVRVNHDSVSGQYYVLPQFSVGEGGYGNQPTTSRDSLGNFGGVFLFKQ